MINYFKNLWGTLMCPPYEHQLEDALQCEDIESAIACLKPQFLCTHDLDELCNHALWIAGFELNDENEIANAIADYLYPLHSSN